MHSLANKIAMLLLFVIVTISCQDNGPTNTQNDPFLLTGSVYDVYDIDTLLIADLSVRIDSLSDQTDQNGGFSFELLPGKYPLEIISEDHLLYNNSVTIEDDMDIEVELEPIYFDMLPLELNNRWTYSYFYEQVTAPIDVIKTGTVTYEITEITIQENDTVFTFLEKIDFKKIYYSIDENPENDTTLINLENEFSIIQRADGSLFSDGIETPISAAFNEYIGFDSSIFNSSSTRRLLEYKRYIPKTRTYDDSVLVINKNPYYSNGDYRLNGSYRLKKDVGILSYTYSDLNGLWYNVELIDFNGQ